MRRDKHGTPISYDLNYRDSLWKSIGGEGKAQEVNRELVRKVDVLLGNEEDFSAMLGIALKGVAEEFAELPRGQLRADAARSRGGISQSEGGRDHVAHSAHRDPQRMGRHGALLKDEIAHVPQREIEILDRVGGGDSFASGLIYGILTGKATGVGRALRRGARRPRHDNARRHQHGNPGRSRARDEGRFGAHRAMSVKSAGTKTA